MTTNFKPYLGNTRNSPPNGTAQQKEKITKQLFWLQSQPPYHQLSVFHYYHYLASF